MTTPTTPELITNIQLPKELPAGYQLAKRTIYLFKQDGEDQYLVLRPGCDPKGKIDGTTILASGFSLEHAFASAVRNHKYELVEPKDHSPRLDGCKFARSSAGLIQVLSADGEVISAGSTRDEAVKQALHTVLSNADDVSFDEYKATSVVIKVENGGRGTYGLVFADIQGQDAFHRFISEAYRNNPTIRMSAQAELGKQKESPLKGDIAKRKPFRDELPTNRQEAALRAEIKAVKDACIKIMLSSPSKFQLHIFDVGATDETWTGHVILHTEAMSADQAIRFAYGQHCEEIQSERSVSARERCAA